MVLTSVSMMGWTLFIALVGVVVILVTTIAKKSRNIAITTEPDTSHNDVKECSSDLFSHPGSNKENLYEKIDRKKPQVYFEIEIDGANKGRIIMELFDDRVPDTAENFRNICKGFTKPGSPGQVLHYKGSTFHLINKGLAAQGGDFTFGTGISRESIVHVTDATIGKHDQPYLVSTASYSEECTIGSQFFITFSSLPRLDGKHIVVGKVVEGFEILNEMENVSNTLGKPKVPVVIVDCGENEQETDAGRE